MSTIHLKYINDSHVKVIAETGILMELAETLTYKAENYMFNPLYKARRWDGNICLLNKLTGLVYSGLSQRIKKFCDKNDYQFSFDDELIYDNISVKEVQDHIKNLNLPEWVDTRQYQIESVVKCLRSKRRTLVSPTASGKSLIIYLISEWYKEKTLIIVPTTGLVSQFESDLRSYGYKGEINTSVGGILNDFNIESRYTITTWQAILAKAGKNKIQEEWFDQFKVAIVDEAHGAKATSLVKIMSAMKNTPYRFGTTGTLNDDNLSKATIEGLFGPIYKSTTTRELIDSGFASDIKIKCIVLKYPNEVKKEFHKKILDTKTKQMRKKTYHEEIEFINNYAPRNKFIKNLTLSLKGNKLIFFKMIEHGKAIFDQFVDQEDVFYVAGEVKATDREAIRHAIEEKENAILVGSLGTSSTGINIKRLNHMIAAAPSKSKIKVLQSIGRMLRQHKEKEYAILYDLVDDLSYGKSKNFVMQHFEERVRMYDAEEFSYKFYILGLK